MSEEDKEAMTERMERWESMPVEQQRMVQKAWISAFAEHFNDFDEVRRGIEAGEIDPKIFESAMSPEKFMQQLDEVEVLSDLGGEAVVAETISKNMRSVIDEALASRKPVEDSGDSNGE